MAAVERARRTEAAARAVVNTVPLSTERSPSSTWRTPRCTSWTASSEDWRRALARLTRSRTYLRTCHPQGLDCDTLKAVATSLGLSTQGGMHPQLRNLLKLDTSANPDCSVDTGNRYAEHGRTTVPDASYKSHHADLVLQRAHYKTKDPRPAASLCALIELLAEHDELTEQVLPLRLVRPAAPCFMSQRRVLSPSS